MKLRKFETQVQHIKYKVLKEIARLAWKGDLIHHITDIPKTIVPGKQPSMRCCVYKERAIVAERVKTAMGGTRENSNVIEVMDIACDECPVSGYKVTDNCRGCIAHSCEQACPVGAITFDENLKSHIDKSKCIECGACAKACPYSAILNIRRPCETACKIGAIHRGADDSAEIDNSKCTACGACMYSCPFGAIVDKSYILDVIDFIKSSDNGKKYTVYAVVAPSIAGQFSYAKTGQVITAIKMLGFNRIVEAALGADMVSLKEAKELSETDKAFITSSCCPAFVSYIEKYFPDLEGNVSRNLSPAAEIARFIRNSDPTSKIVFIGPCTAKKMEYRTESVRHYIDCVITFEELQALIYSRDIEISELAESKFDGASSFGRRFAASGGVTAAIRRGLQEQNLNTDFNPTTCNGIDECRIALLKASKGILKSNFIEGMACGGGCIGGAGCLTHHGDRDRRSVDAYAAEAGELSMTEAENAANENL
ncbi:MAG: 4Fe-4S dicluster domain-containing protein [Bacillota bacterium]|nr:4Fe-4S dicluster domain-containing protein [Bacillota bacterium]